MNGYHLLLLQNRTHGRGGGVALYLKNCLSYKRRFDLEMPNLELLWCEVILLNSKILMGVSYRPPTHLLLIWMFFRHCCKIVLMQLIARILMQLL